MNFKERNAKGFSLIELLIVVAIILIIAAIAIPNLLRSKIAADQASAVGSLQAINTAEVTYSSSYNQGFSPQLKNLGPPAAGSQPSPTAADLIDDLLCSGTKSGYQFTYTPNAQVGSQYENYSVSASPVSLGQTGQNFYFTDSSDVVRYNTSQAATASDPPIGG
jgi:type IV pilus assembly protein PilA